MIEVMGMSCTAGGLTCEGPEDVVGPVSRATTPVVAAPVKSAAEE
ncbi:hypothetical protein AB0937_18265 [Streptomyces sp. NPDC047880]